MDGRSSALLSGHFGHVAKATLPQCSNKIARSSTALDFNKYWSTSSKIIAITGGIGSGKSVVCRILTAMGYDVYDCDREAKRIMDQSTEIHHLLNAQIHPLAVTDGHINRPLLAQTVFGNPDLLARLNAIVHPRVVADILRAGAEPHPHDILFVETAILYESNIDSIVSEVWEVTAPVDIRVQRVVNRNSCTPDDVRQRIAAQQSTLPSHPHPHPHPHPHIQTILNDDISPLLPRLTHLLNALG